MTANFCCRYSTYYLCAGIIEIVKVKSEILLTLKRLLPNRIPINQHIKLNNLICEFVYKFLTTGLKINQDLFMMFCVDGICP